MTPTNVSTSNRWSKVKKHFHLSEKYTLKPWFHGTSLGGWNHNRRVQAISWREFRICLQYGAISKISHWILRLKFQKYLRFFSLISRTRHSYKKKECASYRLEYRAATVRQDKLSPVEQLMNYKGKFSSPVCRGWLLMRSRQNQAEHFLRNREPIFYSVHADSRVLDRKTNQRVQPGWPVS